MTDDDASISDATELFRRVHPRQLIWDDNQARVRPTSAAFNDYEMSVNLGDDLEDQELELDFCLRNHAEHHLASLTAQFVRQEQQVVWRDPLVDHPIYGDDPTHGEVEGEKTKARRSRFAKQAALPIIREESLSGALHERLGEG